MVCLSSPKFCRVIHLVWGYLSWPPFTSPGCQDWAGRCDPSGKLPHSCETQKPHVAQDRGMAIKTLIGRDPYVYIYIYMRNPRWLMTIHHSSHVHGTLAARYYREAGAGIHHVLCKFRGSWHCQAEMGEPVKRVGITAEWWGSIPISIPYLCL